MPVTRTWFNTLVDDNGTNTVGTVWNKAQISGMLTDVDGAVASSWTGYSPALWNDAGVAQTAPENTCKYARHGTYGLSSHIALWLSIDALQLTSVSSWITIAYPTPYPAVDPDRSRFLVQIIIGAAFEVGLLQGANANQATVRRLNGQAFPASTSLGIKGSGLYTAA